MSAESYDDRPPAPVVQGVAPPHSVEAEQSVLGAMLLSEETHYAFVIEEGLKADDFYVPRHRTIYAAMLELYERSEPIDVLTLSEHLRTKGTLDEVGGEAEIDALAAAVPVVGHIRRYASIVRDRALLRRVLDASYAIQASVHNHEAEPREIVERAEKAMLEVARDDRQKDFRRVGDVLGHEIVVWNKLATEGTSLTGTPSGFPDLDEMTGGFQPGNLIIIAARPAMGKCLAAGALVYDANLGRRRPIEEVVTDLERGEEAWVAALGPDFKLRRQRVTQGFRQGRKPVFALRTKLGRSVTATANHPLLTMNGWRRLDELAPGDRIAVPRVLPRQAVDSVMDDPELVLLAALIADGCLTSRATPSFFFATNSPMLDEVREAAAALGAHVHVHPSGTAATLPAARRGAANPITELCKRHGIWGKPGPDKHVPDAVFRLPPHQIARFLGVLWGCDGHVHATDRLRQAGYTTISERLAKDVQHLLLRLGIVAKIRTLRRPVYDGTGEVAREVLITGQEDLRRFCELIPVVGKIEQQGRAITGLLRAKSDTNVDTLPPAAWELAVAAKGDRPWREISVAAGYPPNHNWHVGRRGLSRARATQLAAALDSPPLAELAASDVWWDEVVSIEPAGEAETFDITVPGDHNFVADDVVVHNSALVTNIAENVALQKDRPRPVALFSLEMSEAELAQRFIASQASIRGDDLRKGRLRDERKWKRVMDTAARYDVAPLYVDDSSDVGLIDVRAKARRLHQSTFQEHGGLGLIIVDYLQLMRADARQESRVLQIGEISRGLKILARELEVPVIALSQLSRAVESRTDKRPMLSDLRESGCLTGDTPVHLPETGDRRPIAELVGREPFNVLALDPRTWQMREARATRAFCTGTKPVYELRTRLGRRIRATANHRFLSFDGWRRLDELRVGEHLALPRALPEPERAQDLPDAQLALLGHLIGDGCTLPRHAIQVTTKEPELADLIVGIAEDAFGDALRPHVRRERSWLQVHLASAAPLTHGRRNPVAAWLDELGVFGLRSHEKHVPEAVLRSSPDAAALFLRHLWSTDGCIWVGPSAQRIYYATVSERLALDVQHLLLRLGICATVRTVASTPRPQYAVDVSGKDDQLRFAEVVRTVGTRRHEACRALRERLTDRVANPNRDVIPRAAWQRYVQPAMAAAGITTRGLQSTIGTAYCGSTLYKANMSRQRAARVAEAVRSPELARLAAGDVYWDTIASIEPAGVEPVYDLTVEELHNFVAADMVVHNSIEQDADLVMFIFRDEYYNPDTTDRPGEADLIVAKNRQGAIGEVPLTFQAEYPRFMSLQRAG